MKLFLLLATLTLCSNADISVPTIVTLGDYRAPFDAYGPPENQKQPYFVVQEKLNEEAPILPPIPAEVYGPPATFAEPEPIAEPIIPAPPAPELPELPEVPKPVFKEVKTEAVPVINAPYPAAIVDAPYPAAIADTPVIPIAPEYGLPPFAEKVIVADTPIVPASEYGLPVVQEVNADVAVDAPHPPAIVDAPYAAAISDTPVEPIVPQYGLPPVPEKVIVVDTPIVPAPEYGLPAVQEASIVKTEVLPVVHDAPYPSAIVSAPYPSAIVNAPYPSAIVNAPYPSAIVNAPYPAALVNAPYPAAIVNAPYPAAIADTPVIPIAPEYGLPPVAKVVPEKFIDAPYPGALPIASHYGDPVVQLIRYLK